MKERGKEDEGVPVVTVEPCNLTPAEVDLRRLTALGSVPRIYHHAEHATIDVAGSDHDQGTVPGGCSFKMAQP